MAIEETTLSTALRRLVSIGQQESALVLEDLEQEQQEEPQQEKKQQKVRPSLDSNWSRSLSTETLEKRSKRYVFGCRWTGSLQPTWPQWNTGLLSIRCLFNKGLH